MALITTNLNHIDLVDLRLFVQVAEANSLTRGAERAYLSLPAASLRIKNMEDWLGTKLLYRAKRGVSVTEAGEVFLKHARLVLQQVERLRGDMQPYSQGVRGHVRVFANTTATSELLPRVLGEFLATHSAITIDLQERLSAEVVRAVHEGVAEIGVVASSVRVDGLQTFPYNMDRLVVATPWDHPLAELRDVHFADTLEYDFVGLDARSAIHSFLHQEVSQLGREMRVRIQVGSFDAMCRMIEAKVGIGILPGLAAERHAKSTRIKTVQLLDEWALRELRICVRKLSELPAFARELIEAIVQSK